MKGTTRVRYVCAAAGIAMLIIVSWLSMADRARESWPCGRELANQDWMAQRAFVVRTGGGPYVTIQEGLRVERYWDLRTGLRRVRLGTRHVSSNAQGAYRTRIREYEERVQELLKSHGVPSWAIGRRCPPSDVLRRELRKKMDASGYVAVDSLPAVIGGVLHLSRTAKGGLNIKSDEASGTITCDNAGSGIYYRQATEYPGIIFIRCGGEQLFVFYHKRGELLANVLVFPQ